MVGVPLIRRFGMLLMLALAAAVAQAQAQADPPLDADQGYGTSDKNWIAGLEIIRLRTGYYANFDYHYTGTPDGASVHIRQVNIKEGSTDKPDLSAPKPVAAKRGQVHLAVPLARAREESVNLTVEVVAELRLPSGTVIGSRTLKTRLLWPTHHEVMAMSAAEPVRPPPPSTDKNLISGVAVKKGADGLWVVSFDYYYIGEPEGATVRVTRKDSGDGANTRTDRSSNSPAPATRGWHHHSAVLAPPVTENLGLTLEVMPELLGPDDRVLASKMLQTRMQWPSSRELGMLRELANKTPEQVVERAVQLTDEETRASLEKARDLLARALEADPRLDIAYIEMARVSIKLNWGPEGLKQAESYLDSAIGIRDSVNARILLAYVYAYQKRYAQSQALLAAAAKTNPPNLWLWANWGELEELQGHAQKAIAMYRQVLARPPTAGSYDRARVFTYEKLFDLMETGNDPDGMERLHKQRTQEYGARGCYGVDYARFLIHHRADATGAMVLARNAQEGDCDRTHVRDTLGLAHYLAWSRATDKQGVNSLNQARIYFPVSAKLFLQLAASDAAADVARQLVAAGEPIDAADNASWNALAYALQSKDLPAARRLLKLGAKPATLVTKEQVPVAFLPVFYKDEAGIRLLQRSGVDYSKLRHKGTTALDLARQAGERELVEILERPGT